MSFAKFTGILGLATALHGNFRHRQADCNSIKETLNITNTTVWFTEHIPAGANISFRQDNPNCNGATQLIQVDMCRVAMMADTSPSSNISIEAWLPFNWTGRFLATGNSGLSGCIDYSSLAYTANLGFAAVATNTGHNTSNGVPFYHNPDVLEDWVWRGLHKSVVIGKKVAKAFYKRSHTKSYYLGCSTGGRQGFKEAQAFPDDFDGIVAGAPAIKFNSLVTWAARFIDITGVRGSPGFILADLWQLIQKDVLAQCDALDGAKDGIVANPSLCQYRPEALMCASKQTQGCLTGAQGQKARDFFMPLYGANGTLLYPRMHPSVGTNSYVAGLPFEIGADWFWYVVHEDPSWDPTTISVEDFTKAMLLDPFQVDTWKGDLSGARDRGTKILSYHGFEDGLISSEISTSYYDHVSRTMGLPSSALDSFYRLFLIPGMNHYRGGPGAYYIGNLASSVADLTPQKDVLAAMVNWAENGIAPDTIIGTAYVNSTQASGQVAFQRTHCRYPLRSVYINTTNLDNFGSWKCI